MFSTSAVHPLFVQSRYSNRALFDNWHRHDDAIDSRVLRRCSVWIDAEAPWIIQAASRKDFVAVSDFVRGSFALHGSLDSEPAALRTTATRCLRSRWLRLHCPNNCALDGNSRWIFAFRVYTRAYDKSINIVLLRIAITITWSIITPAKYSGIASVIRYKNFSPSYAPVARAIEFTASVYGKLRERISVTESADLFYDSHVRA